MANAPIINPALLKKIAGSKASAGGNLIRDGKYLFQVQKMMLEQKFDGTMFILELLVKEAQAILDDVKPNNVGSTCSFVCNIDKNLSAAGNVKALVLALLGFSEDEVTTEEVMATLADLVGETQPGRGMLLADETYRKPIRSGPNAGKPFTGHRWQHVEQTEEEIKARRAEMDNKAAA